MSIQAMTRVMETSEASGMARLVLLVMANRAGGDEDLAFPSVDRIAHECRISRRAVQENIRKLIGLGELVSLGVHPAFRTNVYAILPPPNDRVQDVHGGAGSRRESAPELAVTGLTVSSSDSSPTDVPLAPSRAPRADLVFEALAEIEGSNPSELTKSARGALNAAAAAIRNVADGVTPEEIHRRAANFRLLMPYASLTAPALAKHWPKCGVVPPSSTSLAEQARRMKPAVGT